MTSAHPLAIRAESLVKDYQTDWKGRRRRALTGVSFAVPVGAVCGLVGPNGSGKSTTLKLLAGLFRPDAGSCEIYREAATTAVRRGRVGYLPEALGLPDYVTGEVFLRELAQLAGLPAIEEEVARVLDLVGLTADASRRLGEYSKGMRQRIGLAQAVMGDAQVVLLDEPASGLDPRATAQLGEIIRRLRAQGRTVLLSSHFLPQAEEWCDQVVMLERGKVVFAGEIEEVGVGGGLEKIYLEMTAP